MKDDIRRQIDELHVRLSELKTREEEEQKARKAAVKRDWRFTMLPLKDTWHESFDEAVVLYELNGEVLNREECKAVGHADDYCRGGSMAYYFNSATGKIIAPTGGGSVFLSIGRWADKKQKEDGLEALRQLNHFLAAHPEGGDVTDIIKGQTSMGWLK